MKVAAGALGQVAKAANEMGAISGRGLTETARASEGAGKATQGLLKDVKDWRREQVQQSRMSGFLAKEIVEIIPAAEGAKGALSGLIGVGFEAFAGGLGIGLVLEGAKLLAFVINSIGEEERKAQAAADKFAETLGRQTAEVWKNVEALQARRQNIPDFEVEARQQLNSPQENLGGVSLLEKQVSLRAQLAKLDADFNANWKGKGAYDDAGHSWEKAVIAHKREQLLLEQQLTQVTQAIIPIEAVRYEKSLAWAKEFNAAQEKMTLEVEADARRISAMGGSERDRIEADRTNKKIELERKYQEEKEKGVANEFAHAQALANIDDEADQRARRHTQAVGLQNAALRGQIAALGGARRRREGRRRLADGAGPSAALARRGRGRGEHGDPAAAPRRRAVPGRPEEDQRRGGEAPGRAGRAGGAVGRRQGDKAGEFETSGADWLNKSPDQVVKEADAVVIKRFNDEQTKAIALSEQWGQTLGDALGGLVNGTLTLGQVFAQVAQQIVKNLVQIAIQSVMANAASAGAGAASSQAGIPIVGPGARHLRHGRDGWCRPRPPRQHRCSGDGRRGLPRRKVPRRREGPGDPRGRPRGERDPPPPARARRRRRPGRHGRRR